MIIKKLLTLKTLKILITTHFSKNKPIFINIEARKMLITTHFGKFICVCPGISFSYYVNSLTGNRYHDVYPFLLMFFPSGKSYRENYEYVTKFCEKYIKKLLPIRVASDFLSALKSYVCIRYSIVSSTSNNCCET